MSIVDRQAVIDAVTRYCTKYDLRELLADIEVLPSAQPERKTGKWIIGKYRLTCGQCRFTYPNKLMDEMGVVNYCPNCGAYMRGEQDEHSK